VCGGGVLFSVCVCQVGGNFPFCAPHCIKQSMDVGSSWDTEPLVSPNRV